MVPRPTQAIVVVVVHRPVQKDSNQKGNQKFEMATDVVVVGGDGGGGGAEE